MAFYRWAIPFVFALLALVTRAQTVEVNQQNRTIEMTAQSSIQVNADLVSIKVGYHNWGPHTTLRMTKTCVSPSRF